uniref:Uncharacterized protein n=1 Tax=Knipowitschia caucasica TaxID=637954 RepID=A0AAV2L740_KNICA
MLLRPLLSRQHQHLQPVSPTQPPLQPIRFALLQLSIIRKAALNKDLNGERLWTGSLGVVQWKKVIRVRVNPRAKAKKDHPEVSMGDKEECPQDALSPKPPLCKYYLTSAIELQQPAC